MPDFSQPHTAGSYARRVVSSLEELAAQGSRLLRAGSPPRGQPSLTVNLAEAIYTDPALGSPQLGTSKAADLAVANKVIADLSPYVAFARDIGFGTSRARLLLHFLETPDGIAKRTELSQQQHIKAFVPGQPGELNMAVHTSDGRNYYADECLVKVQNLDPSLMRVGCVSAILEAAGYACCQTHPSRYSTTPAAAQIMAEYAGSCPFSLTCDQSVGYAGTVIGAVRPPAEDPYLSNLPRSFADTCGKVRIVVEYLGSPRSMLPRSDQQRQRAELFQQRQQQQQQAKARVSEARRAARRRHRRARRARKAAAAASAPVATSPAAHATGPAAPTSATAVALPTQQACNLSSRPKRTQQQRDPWWMRAQPAPTASDLGQQDAVMLYVPHTELGKRSAPGSAEQASPTSSEAGGADVLPTPPQMDRPYHISSSAGTKTYATRAATRSSRVNPGVLAKRLKQA